MEAEHLHDPISSFEQREMGGKNWAVCQEQVTGRNEDYSEEIREGGFGS